VSTYNVRMWRKHGFVGQPRVDSCMQPCKQGSEREQGTACFRTPLELLFRWLWKALRSDGPYRLRRQTLSQSHLSSCWSVTCAAVGYCEKRCASDAVWIRSSLNSRMHFRRDGHRVLDRVKSDERCRCSQADRELHKGAFPASLR
jgi:ferredoxin